MTLATTKLQVVHDGHWTPRLTRLDVARAHTDKSKRILRINTSCGNDLNATYDTKTHTLQLTCACCGALLGTFQIAEDPS